MRESLFKALNIFRQEDILYAGKWVTAGLLSFVRHRQGKTQGAVTLGFRYITL